MKMRNETTEKVLTRKVERLSFKQKLKKNFQYYIDVDKASKKNNDLSALKYELCKLKEDLKLAKSQLNKIETIDNISNDDLIITTYNLTRSKVKSLLTEYDNESGKYKSLIEIKKKEITFIDDQISYADNIILDNFYCDGNLKGCVVAIRQTDMVVTSIILNSKDNILTQHTALLHGKDKFDLRIALGLVIEEYRNKYIKNRNFIKIISENFRNISNVEKSRLLSNVSAYNGSCNGSSIVKDTYDTFMERLKQKKEK